VRRYYLIGIILLIVLIGAFWAFNSAGAPRSEKVEMKVIPSSEDAVRTNLESNISSAPPIKAEVSTVPSQSAPPQESVEGQASVNPESTPVKAQIAIVIDDWGYNGSVLPLLYKIKSPVTIAVIPHHRFSKSIAREATQRGYQVILHLPLESESHLAAEKDTLNCSMGEKELRQKLNALLESVPDIVGVNNHQGSKATKDVKTMSIVMSELNKNGLFFLDSRTTRKSICAKIAPSIGIKFAQSDGFIDLPPSHLREKEYQKYVFKNLDRISAVAEKRGYAIMIGHDLKVTLDLLSIEIPKLEKKGFKFVFLSDLVQSAETTKDERAK